MLIPERNPTRTQKADPEARTQPDPNFCSLITSLLWVQEFITFMRNNIHVKVKVIAYLFIVFMWIFSALQDLMTKIRTLNLYDKKLFLQYIISNYVVVHTHTTAKQCFCFAQKCNSSELSFMLVRIGACMILNHRHLRFHTCNTFTDIIEIVLYLSLRDWLGKKIKSKKVIIGTEKSFILSFVVN